MYNKFRVGGSQSIKIEKENENIELRKRTKDSSKDKYWANKKENVWDRLSKVQRVPSIENKLGATKSRSNMQNISQRSKIVKQIVMNQSEYQQKPRKPLSPNSASTNNNTKRSDVQKKIRTQMFTAVHDIKPDMFVYSKNAVKAVEEILTVRSLSHSKSSSDEKRYQKQSKSQSLSQRSNSYSHCSARAQKYIDKKDDQSSEDSNEEYKLAPLMVSSSQESMKIVKNLNDFLCCKERSFSIEDIALVKDVIKSDQRYRELDKNPELYREILETQLEKILKHESAVKNALESLECSSFNTQQSQASDIAKPVNEIVSYPNFNQDAQKLEVDVVFKNVPSLEKEIVILRALGEKLEATLKNTSSHRESLVASTGGFFAPITDVILKNVQKYLPLFYELKYEKYVSSCECNIEYTVQTIGVRLIFEVVKEFHMAEKTIFELKQEANRPFYIPACTDAGELRRTSFERLTSNPDEFLRYIKPKNCKVTFNLLEQDSVFFNNLFNKTLRPSNMPTDLSEKEDFYDGKQLTTLPPLCEGGDSQIWKQTIHQKLIKYEIKQPMNCKNKNNLNSDSKDQQYLLEPIIRGKQRRRIRRCLTPMPMYSYCDPKNSLFKTVLVGFVQMSVFIIFIMALTYPDFRC